MTENQYLDVAIKAAETSADINEADIEELLNHKTFKMRNKQRIKDVLLFRAPTINYESLDVAALMRTRYMTNQPIGLACLAGSLRENLVDIKVIICDLEYETLKTMFSNNQKNGVLEKHVKKALEQYKPDLVGISVVYSPAIGNGLRIAKIVKDFDEDIVVAFGGVHATFDHENILRGTNADVVFLKEAEITFVDYIKYLNGDAKEGVVHGIAFLNENNELINLPYKTYPDLRDCPLPAWDLIDTANYYKVSQVCGLKNVMEAHDKTAIIQTSRGCKGNCAFCSVRAFNGKVVRGRSVESVLKEIDILCNQYGIKYLEFIDDDFTYDKERAKAICNGIKRNKYNITWSLDNGVRLMTLDEELIECLIDSGCRLISVGVESGDKDILRRIRKPITIEGLYKKMQLLHNYPELYVKGNFIVGFPFEKYDQILNTFRVASELKFDWVIFSIYSPLIGTDVFEYIKNEKDQIIDVSKINYETSLILPDGFSGVEEFQERVYIENLKCNFIQNHNYNGNNRKRALKDYLRIIADTCPDHAIALHCIADIYESLGDTENQMIYAKKFDEVLEVSDRWRNYCRKLNIASESFSRGRPDEEGYTNVKKLS